MFEAYEPETTMSTMERGKASRLYRLRTISGVIARRWVGGQNADRSAADDVVPIMEIGSLMGDMRTLRHTEVAALLDRTGVSQAAFARPVGVTPRRVNNRVRGRTAVPGGAALLAIVLEDTTAKSLLSMLNYAQREMRPGRQCSSPGVLSILPKSLTNNRKSEVSATVHS